MGQGLYTAIVYGAIEPPTEETDAEGYTDAAEWFTEAVLSAEAELGVHFDSSYEATPFYRGVVLAVSDARLARWWEVAEFTRKAVPLRSEPFDLAAEIVGDRARLDAAVAAWESIRAAGKSHGVEVPLGRFLIVNDWD